jgi:hypothetical protein
MAGPEVVGARNTARVTRPADIREGDRRADNERQNHIHRPVFPSPVIGSEIGTTKLTASRPTAEVRAERGRRSRRTAVAGALISLPMDSATTWASDCRVPGHA